MSYFRPRKAMLGSDVAFMIILLHGVSINKKTKTVKFEFKKKYRKQKWCALLGF